MNTAAKIAAGVLLAPVAGASVVVAVLLVAAGAMIGAVACLVARGAASGWRLVESL